MPKFSRLLKVCLWLLLIACMAILTRKILFKNNSGHGFSALKKEFTAKRISGRWHSANLKPFATIKLFYYSRSLGADYKIGNLAGNVVGFMPLGLLLPLIFTRLRRSGKAIFAVFLISLAFETLQLCFNLGIFDVDDLILNTAGGAGGYILFLLIWAITAVRHKHGPSEAVV